MKVESLWTHESLRHAYVARMDDGSWRWVSQGLRLMENGPDPQANLLRYLEPALGEAALLATVNEYMGGKCATCDNEIDNNCGVGHCNACIGNYAYLHGEKEDQEDQEAWEKSGRNPALFPYRDFLDPEELAGLEQDEKAREDFLLGARSRGW